TNLLALNATIEAARAGEAGKGFAVVAGEVKHLANQTASATEEISQQIARIQSTTQEAVRAVSEITQAIGAVEGVATAIAAAIEEQGAATQEIARNVEQTSKAAGEVASRIARVSDEARQTSTLAGEVGRVSGDVASGIDRLRRILVRVVRTSTSAEDRRQKPRYHVERPGRLSVGARAAAVTILDLSEDGFTASGFDRPVPPDGRVGVSIEGVRRTLPAVITAVDRGIVHARFELDDDTLAAWKADCARLVSGLAPLG
ncbi:methyl-accepting chemotaxis protein, partial [Pararhodospirillum oryzae]|uniref:methyl-accepting chemotaxis protein n=1 Tax=Pararhodospirillum oryzae TaxID=478448 RepID=UPI002482B85D